MCAKATGFSGSKHSLPPAKSNAARGLLKREPKLHNAPASSTPILKRDSSAPRPSPLKISGSTVPGMPPRKPASSGRKARTMSLKTATSCSTCSTCKDCGYVASGKLKQPLNHPRRADVFIKKDVVLLSENPVLERFLEKRSRQAIQAFGDISARESGF